MKRASSRRVAPLSDAQTSARASHWLVRAPTYMYAQCMRVWPADRPTHRGVYSIERLCAYGEYCRRASVARVLTACLLTPLPAVVIIVAVEFVPLSPPSLGWQANYVVFVRVFVCAFAIASSLLLQAKNILPDLKLTLREASAIAASTAAMYTSTLLLFAGLWVFPTPFMIVIGSAPFVWFIALSTIMTVGVARIRQLTDQRQRLVAFVKLATIQASMTTIYPCFQAFFVQLDSAITQIGAVCVLQLIKWVQKRLLSSQIANGIDDYKPEIVVFSVDVFHGLYISSCMQAANSPWTKFVIIAIDIVHQALALRRIHLRTSAIQQLLSQRTHAQQQKHRNLVAIVVQLLQFPDGLKSGSLSQVRVASILSHPISSRVSSVLERLRSAHFATETPLTRVAPTSILPLRLESATADALSAMGDRETAVSANTSQDERVPAQPTPASVVGLEHRSQLLEQTLELLFTCEYLALAEYVECMVPMAYAAYLAAMKSMPNAQYYPQLASMDDQSTSDGIFTILAYASLELASFIVFHWLVRRRLGVSPLHQLAFVLESQIEMVEGKLIAWVLIVLQFPLVHFGADFSFRFNWIQR